MFRRTAANLVPQAFFPGSFEARASAGLHRRSFALQMGAAAYGHQTPDRTQPRVPAEGQGGPRRQRADEFALHNAGLPPTHGHDDDPCPQRPVGGRHGRYCRAGATLVLAPARGLSGHAEGNETASCGGWACASLWTARDGFLDNIFVERLWRMLKYECVYLHAWETGSQTRDGLRKWMDFYNRKRPHSALGGKPPAVCD